MRKKLLICNDDPGIGKIIGKSFNTTEYTVWNCTMHYSDLEAHLNNNNKKKKRYYDTVVFFVGEHTNDTANRIRRLREQYDREQKDIDIFVVMMYRWEHNEEKYYSEGASMCLWFQETPVWLLESYIRLFMFRRRFTDIDRPLSDFLTSHGFAHFHKGFRYLCLLLSLLLEEPERLKLDMQDNYKEIAVRYGDGKGGNVKRDLESYRDVIYKSPHIDPLLKISFSEKPKLKKFIKWMYDFVDQYYY